jgi:hypothetical protein
LNHVNVLPIKNEKMLEVLGLVRQVLYHLGYSTGPFLLLGICQGWLQTVILLISAS